MIVFRISFVKRCGSDIGNCIFWVITFFFVKIRNVLFVELAFQRAMLIIVWCTTFTYEVYEVFNLKPILTTSHEPLHAQNEATSDRQY